MFKYVGKVKMDYENYPGEDLYSDGQIEDELLDIVKQHSESEFNEIIAKRQSWPVMYHLSDLRENVMNFVEINKDETVLEVGAGCGAVTGSLARRAKEVTCIDLSEKRSLINAYRHSELDNIEILLGNFEDVEKSLSKKYDVITLIGVLEYGGLYIHTEEPYLDFLRIMRKHLNPGGRLIIAIENRYGLKYFAGCREDHVKRFFAGIEGYHGDDRVCTFSRPALEKLIKAAGYDKAEFAYPYPDYKFANTVYTDSYQPKKGELYNNFRNFDEDRLCLFNENTAFDQIAEDGLFPVFANSFLVECHYQGDLWEK